jgi:hypothetical protein
VYAMQHKVSGLYQTFTFLPTPESPFLGLVSPCVVPSGRGRVNLKIHSRRQM